MLDGYKKIAEALWMLLDNIDTLDDSCRENDAAFRRLSRVQLKKRFEHLESDGYKLSLPSQNAGLQQEELRAASEKQCSLELQDLREPTLERDLESVLNRYSAENGSNTPDFLLAEYLMGCLAAWNKGVVARDKWYAVRLRPGDSYFERDALESGRGILVPVSDHDATKDK